MSLEEYNYTLRDGPDAKNYNEEWDATDYAILHRGSGGGTFGREGAQATIVYACEYQYVDRFLDTVLGKTVKTSDGLSRSNDAGTFDTSFGSTPERHPYYDNLVASSAEVEPIGTSYNGVNPTYGTDCPLWNKAKVTVCFRPVDYNILPDGDIDTELDRYVTKVPEGSADIQTAQGKFKFCTTPNNPLDFTPGFTVASQRLTYTWHQIPVVYRTNGEPDLGRVPNIDTILPMVGTLNNAKFDDDKYEPGTVLFISFSPKLILPQLATAESYYWDISYIFGVRDYGTSLTPNHSGITGEHIGWNYAYDVKQKRWDLYTIDGTLTGGTTYKYSDFDDLFTVSW